MISGSINLKFCLITASLTTIIYDLVDSDASRCPRLQSSGCKVQQISQTQQQTIYFGLMLSFPGPSSSAFVSVFDDGHDLAPVAYLAVEQVNSRADLMKDYDIQIIRFDGGCDASIRTAVGVTKLYCSCDPIVGIIGPSCDDSSRILSKFTNTKDLSMVNIDYYQGTIYENSPLHTYPNYAFHIFGSRDSERMNKAIASLIEYNKWNNSALLYSGDGTAYTKHTAKKISTFVKLSGYRFGFVSPIFDTLIPLKEVQESLARIIIIIDSPVAILRVLCLAYHRGMVFPTYQWIFQQALDQNFHVPEVSFTYNGNAYKCSSFEINSGLHGSLRFFLNSLSNDGKDLYALTDTGINLQEYFLAYKSQTLKYSTEFGVPSNSSLWAKGFYDAVWMLAIALNRSLVDLNGSLSEFRTGSRVLADSIRSQLLDIDFNGMAGHIKFDDVNHFNKHSIETVGVYQYGSDGISQQIALYSEHFTFHSNTSYTFINASFTTHYTHINHYAVLTIVFLTLATLVLVFFAQIINIRYRNHKAIKAMSPSLNHLIFLGCYLTISGIVINIVSFGEYIVENMRVIRPSMCALSTWLLSVGTSIFFGTICAKTWRLNRIYTFSENLKRNMRFIKGYYLIVFVSILALIDSTICLLWYFNDPFTLSQTNLIGTENGLPFLAVKETCHSKYATYFFVSLLIPKIAVTLASFLLALSTDIKKTEFKTSNIIILTYLIAVIFGLGIPLYAISIYTDLDISIRESLFSICLDITVSIVVFFLFLPVINSSTYCVTTNCANQE